MQASARCQPHIVMTQQCADREQGSGCLIDTRPPLHAPQWLEQVSQVGQSRHWLGPIKTGDRALSNHEEVLGKPR